MNSKAHVSDPQLYALHLACHYKLKRSSMGWWPENHPRWGRSEVMQILSPQTIKSLVKVALLDGTPNGSNPELWTNERGRTVLAKPAVTLGYFLMSVLTN
jgi:hypothetical protein